MSERIGVEDLLAWYRDAGVDEALAVEPVDRFAESEALGAARAERRLVRKPEAAPEPVRLASAETPTGTVRQRPIALSEDAAAGLAREAAMACEDLNALKAALEAFGACPLRFTARSTVFATGDPSAKLTIVGDVPDRDEDAEGEPFVGAAGAMLDRMLAAISVERKDIYLTLASPWRTPGQRQPTPQEKATLAPFLHRHLELAKPQLVLVMGGTACELAFGPGKRLTAMRGKWHELSTGDHASAAITTFHPNFLMRQPEQEASRLGRPPST